MKVNKILAGQRKSFLRDPMSLFFMFIPFIIFSLVKFGLPVIAPYLSAWVDIYDYYDFILFILYLITPMLFGIVLGLQLMDERDQDVLTYIAITPFSLDGYMSIRAVTGSFFGFIFNVILALLLRDVFTIKLFAMFFLASLLVPYYAFAIFAFSKNKVEGLTKGKLMTFTLIGAVIPFYIKSKWSYFLAILPTFWIEKVFNANTNLLLTVFLIMGTAVSLISILFLNRIKSI